MPWTECTAMSQRQEFVMAAREGLVPIRHLCRQFGIGHSTAYKWLARFEALGPQGLQERSRRPRRLRCPTAPQVEQRVVAVRQAHPAWGGRKIRRRLQDQGYSHVPPASTVTTILHRYGLISPEASARHQPWQRFERPEPNELWQMDFKGHFPLAQGRCHPLTVLDDHSRFNVCLQACTEERMPTTQGHLIVAFGQYGLPRAILCDNGPPWAASGGGYTRLTAWLIRLGITVLHGRPFHPQTQGKDERFHQTLNVEVLQRQSAWLDAAQVQQALDPWREVYNHQRPHEALGLATPASRYQPSPRPYPAVLPAVTYDASATVRRVQANGRVCYAGRRWFVSQAFAGEPVALRPTEIDGQLAVFYCHQSVAHIDLHAQNGE
jgi:transposase InsO family protein